MGLDTALIIAGSKLAPRPADRYLARTNVDAQQTEEPRRDRLASALWRRMRDR